ncbi:MAG: Rrf2 family transcriptional regulator [Gemmatimonadetes bacterium]|nr:Rrf2 family transcriptional regulator [Gemmatimonadota bacterium]
MILSQTAEHALRAVLYLAQHEEELVRVGDIAEALRIPRNYLSKILHLLAREGVLASTRGKAGGFRLAVPAARLPLISVLEHFDRFDERRQCLLGRPTCNDRTACAAHSKWKGTAEQVAGFFRDTTVSDLLYP